MGRVCLVTGGAGFIGSHIVTALVKRGDEVRVVDNLCSGYLDNLAHVAHAIDFHQADLNDTRLMQTIMQGVDTVFHQAALASVPLSVERPLEVHHACATGTLQVLQAAQQAHVRRVVYAASSAAYGDSPDVLKDETIVPQPCSPYAVAKLAGEYYCQAFTRTYGLETVGLRYFNVFGPRQDPHSAYSAVIPVFIAHLLEQRSPTIYGDGAQTRDFTYVENVVHGNLLAADVPRVSGQVMNLADGRRTSLLQLYATLQRLLGADRPPLFAAPRAGDVKHSLADISKARELLGYEPRVDLKRGLEQSIDYYRSVLTRA